jgi:quercetin dioxygenase-like cupin family protein
MDFKPKFRVERWRNVYKPNAAMLRLKLEQEGYTVYQWGDQPGMFYGQHKHPEPQSHWIISGSLEITVGGRSYVLEAGDRDFLEAETYHTARVVGDTAVIYLIGEKREVKPVEPPAPPKRKRGRPKKKIE